MSSELKTLLNNQLGHALTHFLNAKGETLSASGQATELVFPTIITALLNHVNGNRSQAIDVYNRVMGKNELPYHNALADLASGSSLDKMVELGNPLVQTLFGQKADGVATQIAERSGVSVASATALLAAALPLMLSYFRTRAWNATQFYEALSGQAAWLEKALPAGLLSLLGVGSVSGLCASVAGLASSLGGITGASVAAGAASGGMAWGKWLGLLLLCGVGVWGLRACMGGATQGIHTNEMTTTSQSGMGNAAASSALGASDVSVAPNHVDAASADAQSMNPHQHDAAAHSQTVIAAASDAHATGAAASMASATSVADDGTASGSVKEQPASDHSAATSGNAHASDSAHDAASQTVAENSSTASNASAETSAPAAHEDKVIAENGVIKFYFATGLSRIAKGADEVAKDAIEAGKAGKKLVISGYTDSTGSAKRNAILSKQRAQAVRAFFIQQGVNAANIELRKPASSVGAQGQNQEGRRVDVAIQ